MSNTENELGEILSEAFPDKSKIIIKVVCQVVLILVICFFGVRGFTGLKEWFSSFKGVLIFLLIFIPSLIWAIYPLTHLKDSLKFFENGLTFNGNVYLHKELGTITFCDYNYGIKSEQYMKSELRNFNVTYISRPKRAYNEAYLNNK